MLKNVCEIVVHCSENYFLNNPQSIDQSGYKTDLKKIKVFGNMQLLNELRIN